MRKLVYLPIAVLSILLMAGCKKDSSGGGTTTADKVSVIDITSPSTGLTFINGGTIHVEGTISDADALTSAKIEIKNKTSGAVLFTQNNTTGTVTFYRFTWDWTVTGMTAVTPGVIKITSKDYQGREVQKELDITLSN